MPYAPFYIYFPDVAEKETRGIIILEGSKWKLPPATYSLLEMYCDEPDCDCRRVFFSVFSSLTKNIEAVVAYGWESPEFYAEWFGDDKPEIIKELKGPILNLASPQSKIAPEILDLIKEAALTDENFIQRIKSHYRLFRNRIDAKT